MTAGSEPAALQIPNTSGEEQKESSQLSDYEERLKKNYEDFMAIVERESKKEIPMPPTNKAHTEGQHILRELFKNPIEVEMNKV